VVVSGDDHGSVRVWDLVTGAPVGDPFTGHTGGVNAVAIGELEGRPVVVSGGGDGSVRVWDLAKRRAVRHRLRPMRLRHAAPVTAAVVAQRQGHVTVVTGCSDNSSWTWDLATCRSLPRIAIPRAPDAMKTSDAVKLSSCCGKFLRGVGEGDGLVVVLAGGQAAVEAAEEPSEEVALGGGVPVAGLAAAVVVGAGAG
jgi:WD40 repeat protein